MLAGDSFMTTAPQQKGGLARSKSLSTARRSEIAKKAAKARWAKPEDKGETPEANSFGVLQIGDVSIDCYVLKDKRRLINKKAMALAIGLKSEGGNALVKTLSGKTIGSIIPPETREKIDNPIIFKPLVGDLAHGYEATVLIDLCDALMSQRDKLNPNQKFLAKQAEIILRSAAKIGIIALVDEATGFIEDKRKDEYRDLWNQFIADEYSKWQQEFPSELFDVFYKIYGLKRRNPKSTKHPKFFSQLLRKYIYKPLAASNGAILEELDEKNPVIYANGGRKYKLFQFLSDEIGMPALRAHIWQTVGIGRSSKNKKQFDRNFYSAFPSARDPYADMTGDLFEFLDED